MARQYLRRVTDPVRDAAKLAEFRNYNQDRLRANSPTTEQEQRDWLSKDARHVLWTFSSEERQGKEVAIGGLTNIDLAHRRAELSLVVASSHSWGKPVRELVAVVREYCEENTIRLVTAEVLAPDRCGVTSWLVGQGFTKEATLSCMYIKSGKLVDSTILTLRVQQ